jgi:hypothetical protein
MTRGAAATRQGPSFVARNIAGARGAPRESERAALCEVRGEARRARESAVLARRTEQQRAFQDRLACRLAELERRAAEDARRSRSPQRGVAFGPPGGPYRGAAPLPGRCGAESGGEEARGNERRGASAEGAGSEVWVGEEGKHPFNDKQSHIEGYGGPSMCEAHIEGLGRGDGVGLQLGAGAEADDAAAAAARDAGAVGSSPDPEALAAPGGEALAIQEGETSELAAGGAVDAEHCGPQNSTGDSEEEGVGPPQKAKASDHAAGSSEAAEGASEGVV